MSEIKSKPKLQSLGSSISYDDKLDNFSEPLSLKENADDNTESNNKISYNIGKLKWADKPFIEQQLHLFPESCSASKFFSKCFDLSDKNQCEEYNEIINKSFGKNQSIIVNHNIINFSDVKSTFIAYLAYTKYNFSNSFLNP